MWTWVELSTLSLNLTLRREKLVTKHLSYSMGLYTVFIVEAYQTSQYVVPCGGIFLSKRRSSLAGSFDSKMNVQSVCTLNT
jgi:hypothetical protein